MEESKLQENDTRVANGVKEFGSQMDIESQSLYDGIKCCLIKLALDGADKIFMDQKRFKMNFFSNGDERKCMSPNDCCGSTFLVENGEEWGSSSSKGCHKCEEFDEKKRGKNSTINLDENERVSTKKGIYRQEQVVTNFPSGDYNNDFSFNFLALFTTLLIKFMGFQFNLLLRFLTFPICLSYFSFMFLMFPLHTLRHIIRRYFISKLFKFLGYSSKIAIQKIQKSMGNIAMRFGFAFFWSSYVFLVLFGLLACGFVFGGLVMRKIVEKPIQATEILNFDYTKTSPVAFVPIMPYSGTSEAYSSLVAKDNAKAANEVGDGVIPHNHKLQLIVSLTVPESDNNRKLGIFQVRVELLSATGKITASSSHPCILRFKSQPIRFIETIIKSAPVIAGFQSESQTLNIKMNEFIEGLEPIAYLKVIVESRAEYKSGAGIPEIYKASLFLESDMPPLKRLIWNWRRTIFVWISFVLFFSELMFFIIFFRPVIIPRGRPGIVYYANKEQMTRR